MKNNKLIRVLLLSTLIQISVNAEELESLLITGFEKNNLRQEIEINNKSILEEKEIESFPKGNGNINEVLKFLPDIEVLNNAQTSENAGELVPEDISISGGRFYQNNFQIDSISNNSLLDPANNKVNSINNVKGNTQEIFLDTDMVKSIEVYDSNIPAKFGRFTGGVVDIKTKHAQDELSGKIKYRFTSDKLTNFFVKDAIDFNNSNSSTAQPRFKKEFFTFTLNSPIFEDDAIYFNTVLKKSIIPLKHFNQPKSESRTSNNFFFKYSKYLEDDSIIDYTFVYAPYEENRFISNVKNSDYTVKGGGLKSNITYEKEFKNFKLDSIFDISYSENSRTAPSNFYNWATTNNKSWGKDLGSTTSKEGGYGDISKEQLMATLKNDFDFDFFKTGFEIKGGEATKRREEETSIYKVSANDTADGPESGLINLNCTTEEACIEGDQYASSKITYKKYDASADILSTSAYIEKSLDIQRLNFRLGLRYDYNNYMDNHDIAYRTLSTFDIFNNKNTLFSIGVNRYYGNSFLTYKLKEAEKPYVVYTRGLVPLTDVTGNQYFEPEAWQISARKGTNKNRYSDLKTPYSDEISLAIHQKFWDGKFSIKWIERDNKNGFTKTYSSIQPDGYKYYSLSNDGKSSHDSLRLSYSKEFDNHSFSINYSKSKTKRTNETYQNLLSDDNESTSIVYYDGKFTESGTLTKKYDTTPNIIKLMYRYNYKNFTLHTFLKYKTSYKKMEETTQTQEYLEINPATGDTSYSDVNVYDVVTHSPIVKVDLSLAYDLPIGEKHKVQFKTDIKNLFNKKEGLSTATNKYYLGRSIWFELAYKF